MIENKYQVVCRNDEPIPCLLYWFKIIIIKLQIVKKVTEAGLGRCIRY